MPGVNLSDFGLCVSDFNDIREKCEITFALLARSRSALLETINPQGATDALTIPVGDYRPENSTGEIAKNAWGNFPSGETFIVPNPFQAEGCVTVRGSIPKRPLDRSEWIRFRLAAGRMIYDSIEASSDELLTEFKALFFTVGDELKDENSNALAELGIGTNSKIERLTGNPIFDEKKLGTVHIAFGRNDQFKGPLLSTVHHDIVCTGATLTLEGYVNGTHTTLINNASFSLSKQEALPPLDSFPECDCRALRLTLGKTDYSFQYGAPEDPQSLRMGIEYESERENVKFIIAEGREAEAARLLVEKLSLMNEASANALIDEACGDEPSDCKRILTGLLVYGIFECV